MSSKTLPRRTATASLVALLALASPTHAAPRSTTPIDCTRPLLAPGTTHAYDLSPLSSAGPLQITAHYETSPSITSYTLDLSLCSPLTDSGKACGSGSRVCQRVSSRPLQGSGDGGEEVVNQIIPLYGDAPSFSYEIEDVSRDGREWTLELKGPEYAGVRQKLELEMKCDEQGGDVGVAKAKWESFDAIEGKRKVSWRTRWACPLKEGGGSGGGGGGKEGDGGETAAGSGGGWGFFSWFFFLIILGLIIYFVLGTYQNHQQYGVYEIPHRDFWREAPYLVQDAAKHAWKSIAGGSGGGGSSARYEPL